MDIAPPVETGDGTNQRCSIVPAPGIMSGTWGPRASRSISFAWLYSVGFLVTVLFVAGTGMMLANSWGRQMADTKRELQNLALALSEQIVRTFDAVELVQKSLSEPLGLPQLATNTEYEKRVSQHGVHLTLSDKIIGLPYIAALTFVSADGKLINSSVSWPIPVVDVADRDFFTVLKSTPALASFIGRPVLNRALGTWTIHVARAVRGANNQFLGLILATMELRSFEQAFAAIALRPGSSISLLRGDGVLLARHPRIEASVGETYTGLFVALDGSHHATLRRVSSIDGKDRVFSARRLAPYPLVIAISVEVKAAMALWGEEALSIMAAAGILITIIASLIFAGANRIVTQLRKQNLQFDAAINNMAQGLCMFDGEHGLVVCNDRYAQMYSLSPEQTKPGTTFTQLLKHRIIQGTFVKYDRLDKYIRNALEDLGEKSNQIRITELDDGRFISVARRHMDDGGWVATHEDITELRQNERALGLQNERFDAALNAMSQGLVMIDSDQSIVVVNRLYIQMYNLSPDIVKPGCTFQELLAHRAACGHLLVDPTRYGDEILASISYGQRVSFVVETSDGREISVTNQPMSKGGWLSTHEDITERRKADAKISHMALHDTLTNLPNRVFFREQIEHRLAHRARDQKFAVLCLDLDGFKRVNDTLGHSFGDRLLQQVAGRMRGCLREGDCISRLGGDEFAVLQGSLKESSDAIGLADRLFEAARAPFDLAGQQVVIGVSIGIAMAPTDAVDPDQLLKNADLALYRAKAGGRGTYRFFEPEMDALMQARRVLELDLREALANEQFEIFYQPLVNLDRHEITGFEALIRWNHPKRGLVSPADFIPLAEETGIIVPIGEWVLRQACREAINWPTHVSVAVNLSPAQFRMRDLPQMVLSALTQAGLSSHRLELEITESVLLIDNESTVATLHQLRDLGVRISMDDFGIGYSSLNYLRKFPFDKIKIDRSFVQDLASSEDAKAIVRAITGLGASLGMTTTGEGVETQEMLDYLKEQGCTEGQGYFFGKPSPASEAFKLFSKQLLPVKDVA